MNSEKRDSEMHCLKCRDSKILWKLAETQSFLGAIRHSLYTNEKILNSILLCVNNNFSCCVVIVDTNQWFHKTEVLPGDISITIGAEYDW